MAELPVNLYERINGSELPINLYERVLTGDFYWTTKDVAPGNPFGVDNYQEIDCSSTGQNIVCAMWSGEMNISNDYGENWTNINSGCPINYMAYTGVACDSTGTKLLIGGQRLYQYEAGVWTERQPLGDMDITYWQHTESDSDGSVLMALAMVTYPTFWGRFFISTDSGINWTEPIPTNTLWRSIVCDEDGSFLMAGNTTRLWISTNGGADWSETRPAGDIDTQWEFIDCDSTGTNLVAATWNPTFKMYVSNNGGTNWTESKPAGNITTSWVVGISGDGNTMIANDYSNKKSYLYSGGTWAEELSTADSPYTNVINNIGDVLVVGGGYLYIGRNFYKPPINLYERS